MYQDVVLMTLAVAVERHVKAMSLGHAIFGSIIGLAPGETESMFQEYRQQGNGADGVVVYPRASESPQIVMTLG
jgi:hypothetical protein